MKTKIKKTKKRHQKEKKQIIPESRMKDYMKNVSKKQSEFKSYVNRFRADVNKKKKSYQSYSRKFLKKRIPTGKNEARKH